MTNEIVKTEQKTHGKLNVFGSDFEKVHDMARCLSSSSFVPESFRDSIANCIVALDISQRTGASPLAVMQSIYDVHGKIGFEAKFVIGMVNTCGKYSPLRFKFDGDGDDYGCRAVATYLHTGEELIGTKITWRMVQAEGWSNKKGSKWLTMPEQMYKYRAASFWEREFDPGLTMGIPCVDEIEDMEIAGSSILVNRVEEKEDPLINRGAGVVPPNRGVVLPDACKHVLELAKKRWGDDAMINISRLCRSASPPVDFEKSDSSDIEWLMCEIDTGE